LALPEPVPGAPPTPGRGSGPCRGKERVGNTAGAWVGEAYLCGWLVSPEGKTGQARNLWWGAPPPPSRVGGEGGGLMPKKRKGNMTSQEG
jgi:hypothetical protein